MEFRLTHSGPLRANGSPKEKQKIRRELRPQIEALWRQDPLNYAELKSARGLGTRVVGDFTFAPLVSNALSLVCRVNILFLRRSEPGVLTGHGGDIDNRLKTLFDALSIPQANSIPKGDKPKPSETPFFDCLLEDDQLITEIDVTTDRLNTPGSKDDVLLILHVRTRPTRITGINIHTLG